MNDQYQSGEHRKAFAIVPTPEDDTKRILESRWRVCVHEGIEDGAARMFVLLLDGSLNPQLNFGRRGVISVSQPVLAEWLNCGERSVRKYMNQLRAIGEIWIRYKTLPHGARILEYFLTCIRPQDEFEFARALNDQQLWGRGTGKAGFKNEARGTNGRYVAAPPPPTRPDLPVGLNCSESTETPNFAASGGNKRPLTAAIVAADGGNKQPLTAAESAAVGGNKRPSSAATVAAVGGNKRPSSAAKLTGAKRDSVGDRGSFENRGEPTPPADAKEVAFKVWEKRVTDMRNSDLRKLEEVVVREFQAAKSEPARDLAKRKLVTIRLQLRGPVVEDKAQPKPASTTAKPKPAAMPFDTRKALWEKTKKEAAL